MLFYSIPRVESYSKGMKLFDLMPGGYSFEYATQLLVNLGETGRDLYLFTQLPLDFLYPGLFAISCTLLLSWLILKNRNPDSTLFYGCYIPVLAGLFDYLENIFIAFFLIRFPQISALQVEIASTMTLLKSLFTTLFFVFLLFSIAIHFTNKPIPQNGNLNTAMNKRDEDET